jgi:hypothetical protein
MKYSTIQHMERPITPGSALVAQRRASVQRLFQKAAKQCPEPAVSVFAVALAAEQGVQQGHV